MGQGRLGRQQDGKVHRDASSTWFFCLASDTSIAFIAIHTFDAIHHLGSHELEFAWSRSSFSFNWVFQQVFSCVFVTTCQ